MEYLRMTALRMAKLRIANLRMVEMWTIEPTLVIPPLEPVTRKGWHVHFSNDVGCIVSLHLLSKALKHTSVPGSCVPSF
jgi:hypothetical protein